ncbi:MAG: 4-hydroxythreonine-4-phosphate dehydrogenase PdxA [Burkholderiales bacterium]|nr:4-hydroxythreonine-4-phosphate dehydrogenase PdxA [Burkholderiales bacterium]
MKPKIALVIGDPAGVGPELVVKLLADTAASDAHIFVIGSRAVLADAMRATGIRLDLAVVAPDDIVPASEPTPVMVDWPGIDASGFAIGQARADNGKFMLDMLTLGAQLTQRGVTDALCFAPLNKGALRAGGMQQQDELRWFEDLLGCHRYTGELNVLDTLWTSRVTSHVALRDVSNLLTPEGVADAAQLITDSLRAAGKSQPRVAVCGLNPHNGDNGNYGREEGDVIEPGIALARSRGCAVDGPFPADTIFVRARNGQYDGIVTMYHDQGQIAMKLMGFERGVTVQGGLPIPVTTPAHGTAYDIAGQGIANMGAMKNAFALACRMAHSRV